MRLAISFVNSVIVRSRFQVISRGRRDQRPFFITDSSRIILITFRTILNPSKMSDDEMSDPESFHFESEGEYDDDDDPAEYIA